MRLYCWECKKSVSSDLPEDLILRAVCVCPECIEAGLVIFPKRPVNVPIEDVKCPECEGPMVARANRQTGEKFWGCKKYPNCRGTRDSMGLSREEREAQKAKEPVVQEEGFRFLKR